MTSEAEQLQNLDQLETVVADPLRFKLKLRIGDDAYAVLKLRKNIQGLWDVGGMALTGASLAKSSLVASTFFAGNAGILSMLGIGAAAATPIGWVIAAAVASGGAYYGISRLIQKTTDDHVHTVPRFINTPIDLLGMKLLDMIGGLSIRMAAIDGQIVPAERDLIRKHFISQWGYDASYVDQAMAVLESNIDKARLPDLAKQFAQFSLSNPDCNAAAMQAELLGFLRDVMHADNRLDDREEMAIEAVQRAFRTARLQAPKAVFANAGRTTAKVASKTGAAVAELSAKAGTTVADGAIRTKTATAQVAVKAVTKAAQARKTVVERTAPLLKRPSKEQSD